MAGLIPTFIEKMAMFILKSSNLTVSSNTVKALQLKDMVYGRNVLCFIQIFPVSDLILQHYEKLDDLKLCLRTLVEFYSSRNAI